MFEFLKDPLTLWFFSNLRLNPNLDLAENLKNEPSPFEKFKHFFIQENEGKYV